MAITINSAGKHLICNKKQVEYGINNGKYWFFCWNCKKSITKKEIK